MPKKGYKQTLEHNKKRWLGKKRVFSTGHKKNMSESAKKRGVIPPSRKGVKLSNDTRIKMSRSRPRGKLNHFWRGGICDKNIKIRMSFEYKLWRESVFKRDNYTCIWCGAKSGKGKAVVLNADHIKSFAFYPELRFAIDNGRTLCRDCHKTTENFGCKNKKWKI